MISLTVVTILFIAIFAALFMIFGPTRHALTSKHRHPHRKLDEHKKGV